MTRTLLIVEDSPQMAANLEIALSSMDGLDVHVAACGAEALRWLESDGSPDVAAVVTDLDLPKVDGFEIIERMRANPRFADTPIIVSSGSTDPESPSRAMRLGADAYFVKPYSPGELRRTVESLLRVKDDV